MLYVFFGDDVTMVRTKALACANVKCAPEGDITFITPENSSKERVNDALGAASLFHPHEVFVLDTLSEDAELFAHVLEHAVACAESANYFIVIEGPLLAGPKKALGAHAEECTEYKKVKKEWNAFALGDALVARDKKALWILLQEAWKNGESTEALIGTLNWQLKMLRLAEVTKNAEEAGQKSFVYDKAKRALRNFKEGEVTQLSHKLVLSYHEGHTGKRNIDNALEAWVLTL